MTRRPKWYGSYRYYQKTCIQCKSTDLEENETVELTRVSTQHGPDPNIYATAISCRTCGVLYTREWQPAARTAWATLPWNGSSYVVAGYPAKGPLDYYVHCPCGSWATNIENDTVRVSAVRVLTGEWECAPQLTWRCNGCGYKGHVMLQPEPPTLWERLLMEDA